MTRSRWASFRVQLGTLDAVSRDALGHVQVIGSMVSTSTVPPSRNDSIGEVIGDWMVRGTLDVAKEGAKVSVSGQIKEDYQGAEIPAEFPLIPIASIGGDMKGKVKAGGASSTSRVKKVADGNTVLIGTPGEPIEIKEDVLIKGDLIITGTYKGVGTIYVTGNIFIPYDLKAETSAFPFSSGGGAADALDDDGLGLAAGGSIFVGDAATGVIGAAAQVNTRPAVDAMYSWFGKGEYEALYGGTFDCDDGDFDAGDVGVNLVDSFLYAAKSIEGKSGKGSFSIRGGILTNYYNILNADSSYVSSDEISPAHGHHMNRSYIEYDERIQTGKFPVLEQLGEVLRKDK